MLHTCYCSCHQPPATVDLPSVIIVRTQTDMLLRLCLLTSNRLLKRERQPARCCMCYCSCHQPPATVDLPSVIIVRTQPEMLLRLCLLTSNEWIFEMSMTAGHSKKSLTCMSRVTCSSWSSLTRSVVSASIMSHLRVSCAIACVQTPECNT